MGFAVTSSQAHHPRLATFAEEQAHRLGHKFRILLLHILHLDGEGLQAEHTIGRDAPRKRRSPQAELPLRMAMRRAIRPGRLKIEIFERSTETASLPKQVADHRASAAGDRC